MKIAIQGQRGSYHDTAVRQFFGDDAELVECETFKDTFASLADKRADVAVVAIENSLFGSINEVYDLLMRHKFWISGEVYLRIKHALIGTPEAELTEVKEVHSHPIALAQCEAFLDNELAHAERFENHDTAGSVADVAQWNDLSKAAIANATAAELHDMKVLEDGIETNKHNYTRFIVLEREKTEVEGSDKTSVVLQTAHRPGGLHKVLGAFAARDINLSKIESRPIIGTAFKYMFYLDFEAGLSEDTAKQTLDELEQMGHELIILGSYRRGQMPENG